MNSTNDGKNKWFNWGLFITLFVNTGVGIASWYAINRYNVSRDVENKKREIKTEYLIKAYRAIEKNSGYPTMDLSQATEKDIKRTEDLEQAVADIQLFGSIYQIREVRKACIESEPKQDISDPNLIKLTWRADELLLDIRRELRKELLLEEIEPEEDKREGIRKLRWSKMIEESLIMRKKQSPEKKKHNDLKFNIRNSHEENINQ